MTTMTPARSRARTTHPQFAAPSERAFDAALAGWRTQGLVGIDEVGRGPLAGPVCAAAVMLPVEFDAALGRDSKAVSARARPSLAQRVEQEARAWGIAWASVEEIDRLNILHATELAMRRALQALLEQPGLSGPLPCALIDGNRVPPVQDLAGSAFAVVKGDARVPEIGAASVLAKVARDTLMARYDDEFPGYNFAAHKGYGTRAHQAALARLGPCEIHRRSFAPVRALGP